MGSEIVGGSKLVVIRLKFKYYYYNNFQLYLSESLNKCSIVSFTQRTEFIFVYNMYILYCV